MQKKLVDKFKSIVVEGVNLLPECVSSLFRCPDFAGPCKKNTEPLKLFVNRGSEIKEVKDFQGNTCCCPPGFGVLTEEDLAEPFKQEDMDSFFKDKV